MVNPAALFQVRTWKLVLWHLCCEDYEFISSGSAAHMVPMLLSGVFQCLTIINVSPLKNPIDGSLTFGRSPSGPAEGWLLMAPGSGWRSWAEEDKSPAASQKCNWGGVPHNQTQHQESFKDSMLYTMLYSSTHIYTVGWVSYGLARGRWILIFIHVFNSFIPDC